MASAAPWSYTASRQARSDDDVLIVCCLTTASLGIDSMAAQVADLCGEEEGVRWRQRRAEEYGNRLLEALSLHLPTTELIVHLEEDGPDTTRVVVSNRDAPDPAQRETELGDRVAAIRRRTWLGWWEGLQITMAALARLNEPEGPLAPAEKAA